MKIVNIGSKIIGIGQVNILPGETKEIPETYEMSPILEVYKKAGLAKVIGKPKFVEFVEKEDDVEAAKRAEAEKKAAEELRKARLASLEGITEEDIGKIANELGINPADCKDQADVLKKVKAALRK